MDLAEIEAAIAKAEAAGRTDLADKLRPYADKLRASQPAPVANADQVAIDAAIAKAEAAGRTDLADKLRAYLPAAPAPASPAPAPAPSAIDGPVPPPVVETSEDISARQLAEFEAANPTLAGKYSAANLPEWGDVVGRDGGPVVGGFGGSNAYTVKPWRAADLRHSQDSFGETAGAMMEGPIAGMKAFGGGLTGGPSPTRDYITNDPLLGMMPGWMQTGLGGVGDAGGAAMSAVGAGLSGLVGLGVEAVPGQNSAAEKKLADDLMGMSMFAVPELAGVSSIASAAPAFAGRAAKVAESAAKVAPKASTVVETAVKAAPEAATKAAPVAKDAAKVAVKTPEEIGALTRKAASGGMGAVKAQEELAAAAKLNPEAKAAADRLGIDLPADVFSDSENVRATVGLTRSEVGKEPEAIWRGAVKAARDKADEIIAAMDGSPDIASVSENVKSSLQSAQAGLKSAAGKLYDAVDARVPKSTRAEVSNTVKALNKVIEDLGGPKGMSAAEKALYDLVTGEQPVTYGRLLREKNLIGKAIARGESPYSSLDGATLSRMYGALSDDQLATVATIGDDALRATLREANQMTAKQKALEKRIVSAFGSDLDGSIGAKLKSAVTTAAKGDIAGLQRILKTIPEDLRKSATVSAISAATRSARATEPGFGIPEFSKVFSGIMANKPVANLIGKTIGPEAMGMMKDLQTVAQRISIADSNVLRTGKANQALVGALTADGLVSKVLNSTGGQRVTQAAAIGMGTMAGGPMGGMIAGPIATALTKGRPDMLARAGKLFASEEFQKLAVEAAQGAASKAAVEAVKKSSAFKAWSSMLSSPAAAEFIKSLGLPTAGQAANTPGPDIEALWGRY